MTYGGFENAFVVDPLGRKGGLVLFWSSDWDVSIENYSQRHIKATIREGLLGNSWCLTCFYGHPDARKRSESWDLLKSLRPSPQMGWLCLGDFNAIMNLTEKVGGSVLIGSHMSSFSAAISSAGLVDLGDQGQRFTWSNKRKVLGSFIKERLDRAFGNVEWINMVGLFEVKSFGVSNSDHCCLEIKWGVSLRRKAPGGQIGEMIWLVLRPLLRWVAKVREESKNQEETLLNELAVQIQKEDEFNQVDLARIRSSLEGIRDEKEAVLRHQAKQIWLKEGDKNTRYFHACVNNRRKKNGIEKIRDSDGFVWEEKGDIQRAFHGYFNSLFTSSDPQSAEDSLLDFKSMVSESQNVMLTQEVNMEEVCLAVQQIDQIKAPGPDGFSSGFYKQHWDVVGLDVLGAVDNFLKSGVMPPEVNLTHIALIPKVLHPESVTEFRPISLCNVLYKIISKVLANRLKKVLPGVVGENQSAFVQGRLISDNILVAFEVLHSMSTKQRGHSNYMAVKLDMSKAYDRMEWSFVDMVMSRMGFCLQWRKWILACLTSVTYAVIVNGEPGELIVPTRGLRQGDPLSPMLFVICSEVLSFYLQQEIEKKTFRGFPFGRGSLLVSHLFFADDSLIFCRATKSDWLCIRNILAVYERQSGQMVNVDKTALYFSKHTSMATKNLMKSLIGVKEIKAYENYLGLPSLLGRSKKKSLMYIVERVKQKVNSWKNNFLSFAGREVLIKSVLQSIPTYAMQIFRFPVNLCQDLDQVFRSFWWGGRSGEKQKISWVSWERMCKAKEEGGLGIRSSPSFNEALLAKQFWRILKNPNSLVGSVMKLKYFPNSSILYAVHKASMSYAWQSILSAGVLIKSGLVWRIGDGRSVRIWKDNWLGEPLIWDENLRLHGFLEEDRVVVLMDANMGWWNMDLIAAIFPEDIASKIFRIPLYPRNGPDQLSWNGTKSGVFSVKSGYHRSLSQKRMMEASSSFRNGREGLWRSVWSLKSHASTQVFLWRVLNNALPTYSNLLSRRVITDARCPLCHKSVESLIHVMWTCDYTVKVFENSSLPIQKLSASFLDFEQLWNSALAKLTNTDLAILATTCRLIWQRRNSFLYENEFMNSLQLARYAISSTQPSVLDPSPSLPYMNSLEVWQPPEEGFIKVNWDAGINEAKNKTGMGVVIRDSTGDLLGSQALSRPIALSPTMAEAEAALSAVWFALDMGFRDIVLEGDSQLVIRDLQSEESGLTEWCGIIKEIKRVLKGCLSCQFSHVRRTGNGAAHFMAKEALKLECPQMWVEEGPDGLSLIVQRDKEAFISHR
ncbi:uncharacterized protein LOC120012588 [Tripterygium wilfordii]|uniref:uncharacterized protein LOC120012588 n=1 Tax=Tripterygium wilfordii TaxID=458696 RepID=UPI0018F859B2|nr:uncharacterized protein LOC120012588 [Tripterygium wilfordii]